MSTNKVRVNYFLICTENNLNRAFLNALLENFPFTPSSTVQLSSSDNDLVLTNLNFEQILNVQLLTNLREQHRGHLYSPTYQKILFRNKKEFYCTESNADNKYGIEGAQAVSKENIQLAINAFEVFTDTISVGDVHYIEFSKKSKLGVDARWNKYKSTIMFI